MEKPDRTGRRALRGWAPWLAGALGAVAVVGAVVAHRAYEAWLRHLPEVGQLATRPLPAATVVLDRHGRWIGEIFAERRFPVSLDELPGHLTQAILAAEDDGFFRHGGVDLPGLARAAWVNARAGRIVQGGSTITQQAVKNLLDERERSYERKLRETILALRLERQSSKREILALYLNQVYFGSGAHGIEQAARTYFEKSAAELSLSESALLAGLIPRPAAYSPHVDPEKAERRRRFVLERMREEGFLSQQDFAAALERPPLVSPRGPQHVEEVALHFVEHVRQILGEQLGAETLRRGGLVVQTTLDLDLQREAARSLEVGLPADETALAASGDGEALAAPPEPDANPVQGALIAYDLPSGGILALVGGRDAGLPGLNRALASRRQPGSAFKPIVYAAALERGRTGASLLVDRPAIGLAGAEDWRPRNFDRRFHGRLTLREALVRSVNNAAIHLLDETGLGPTLQLARRLGIASALLPHPTLALGTSEVSLGELTAAYGVFAAQGRALAPHAIVSVRDRDGEVLLEHRPPEHQVMDPRQAYVMVDLLRAAVHDPGATGAAARALGPVAGKTGTSSNAYDAWFVGFSPRVAAGVWVGRDRPASIAAGSSGGRTALPIWTGFMRTALEAYPSEGFAPPPGIVVRSIDADTGLLADARSTSVQRQAFVPGTEPKGSVTPERKLRQAALAMHIDAF